METFLLHILLWSPQYFCTVDTYSYFYFYRCCAVCCVPRVSISTLLLRMPCVASEYYFYIYIIDFVACESSRFSTYFCTALCVRQQILCLVGLERVAEECSHFCCIHIEYNNCLLPMYYAVLLPTTS